MARVDKKMDMEIKIQKLSSCGYKQSITYFRRARKKRENQTEMESERRARRKPHDPEKMRFALKNEKSGREG